MEEKVVRDLDLLWILHHDEWLCYNFDENGDRILVGSFKEDQLISEQEFKELNGISYKKYKQRKRSKELNGSLPKSDFVGVNLHSQAHKSGRKKKWQASFTYQKKRHYFGTFETEIEAARAYDKGVTSMDLADYKRLNFN